MTIKLPERPTEAALPPGLVAVDTQWGVRVPGGHQFTGIDVDEYDDAESACRYLAALQAYGQHSDAYVVSRADSGAPWVRMVVVDGWVFTDKMLTAEVAALFRVDRRTVERWADAGRLAVIWTPGSKENHGHRRFSRQQVEHILAGGGW